MDESHVLRLIASLVAVLLLLFVSGWLARRAGWARARSTESIQLLGMRNLGARNFVAVVQVDDVRMVIGVSATQINLLHTLPAKALSSSGSAQTSPCGSLSGESALTDQAVREAGHRDGRFAEVFRMMKNRTRSKT